MWLRSLHPKSWCRCSTGWSTNLSVSQVLSQPPHLSPAHLVLLGFWLGSLSHRAAVCGLLQCELLKPRMATLHGIRWQNVGGSESQTALTNTQHQIKCLLNLSCYGGTPRHSTWLHWNLGPENTACEFCSAYASHCPGPMSTDCPQTLQLIFQTIAMSSSELHYIRVCVCARAHVWAHMPQ